MARKNQSLVDDIIELTSKFPWWVGSSLAIVSYFWLHSIASKGMPHVPSGDLSAGMKGGLFYAFATLGQYVLPGLFGIGDLVSLLMTIKRKKVHRDVTGGSRKIDEVSWQDFELLIGEHFRRQGFAVQETPDGPDGGIDLILKKNGATYVVQCKHYKAYKVGVKPIRELLGVMASEGAAGGYVVTSGEFTEDAIEFALKNNIELIDGRALTKILKSTPKPSRQQRSTQTSSPSLQLKSAQKVNPGTIAIKPSNSGEVNEVCPKCGSPLVVRIARKGSRAGQKFWGCTGYPGYRFARPLD